MPENNICIKWCPPEDCFIATFSGDDSLKVKGNTREDALINIRAYLSIQEDVEEGKRRHVLQKR